MKTTEFPILEISKLSEKESWRKEINRPIYHLHKWWAQRLGSVFRAILIYLLKADDEKTLDLFYQNNQFDKIIFDPFMGSGTTLGEALKLGAKVIGCDINPVSSFLVRQELTRVPLTELDDQMNILESTVAAQIKKYYLTVDPQTGLEIPVLYYFWVKLVTVPTGERIPLFSSYVFAQNAYPSKKPAAQIVCPKCWAVLTDRFDSTAVICPYCKNAFNPQDGPAKGAYVTDSQGTKYKIKSLLTAKGRLEEKMFASLAVSAAGEKKYLATSSYDEALYQKAAAQLARENLPLPQMAVREGHNTDQARGYNYLAWQDFFNQRQLLCLGLLLKEILLIADTQTREQFLCLFSSTLEFNNMFCSYKGEGTGAVRPIFSNHILKPERTPMENSVWGTEKSSGCFSTLYKTRFLAAKKYLDTPFELKLDNDTGHCVKVFPNRPLNSRLAGDWSGLEKTAGGSLILCGDSASVPLPAGSVDMVVTDPPYFDYIHYSELSDFFYAWLAPALKERYTEFFTETSGREHEVQHVLPDEFSNMLSRVFAECHRVMKDDAKLCFTFHHARPEGWAAIAGALIRADFYIQEAFPVYAELMASTPKAGAKEPISLDIILVCTKNKQTADNIADIASKYIGMLKTDGKKLSLTDIFVVNAAQTLVYCVNNKLDKNDTLQLLDKDLHRSLTQKPESNNKISLPVPPSFIYRPNAVQLTLDW